MAASKTTNPAPQVTESKMAPGAIFGVMLGHFTNTREAALLATYSVTAYLLCVNHFRKSADPEYKTVGDATAYIKTELAKQTPVKGGMLDRYVNTGRELFSKIAGSEKIFLPLLQKLGSMTDADAAPVTLRDYFADHHKIKSLSDAMTALGYSTGHKTPEGPKKGGVKPADAPASAAKSVTNMIAKAAEARGADRTKAELAVAREVANTFESPVMLARQAIERIANPAELSALANYITAQIDRLNDLAKKAQDAVSETPANAGKPQKGAGRARTTAKPGRVSVTTA